VIKNLLKHPLIDDYKAVSVNTYITMRKKVFPNQQDDFTLLEGFKTMIVFSLSYPKDQEKFKGKGHGLISRYSYGTDYHLVYRRLFSDLEEAFIKEGIQAKGYADISPIDERFAGLLAGLGFMGKNQLLIHPDHGTYHFLGVLLIDQDFTTTPYIEDSCGDCTLCIDACPPSALHEGGYDKRKCTSYVTQMKDVLTAADIKPMKTMLFGCDICQRVCPKNKAIKSNYRDVFKPDENSQLHLETLLQKSNKEISRLYKDYAFSYRGGLVLKRNAFVLLYNQRQTQSLSLMKEVYEQYKHVAWFEETARFILNEMEKKS
jgi:epoxyqueuosine reductase